MARRGRERDLGRRRIGLMLSCCACWSTGDATPTRTKIAPQQLTRSRQVAEARLDRWLPAFVLLLATLLARLLADEPRARPALRE